MPDAAPLDELGLDPRELFQPVADHLSPDRDDHPGDVEVLVSGLIGLLEQIQDDAPMPGGGDESTRPSALTGEAPPGTAEEMLDAGLLALADSLRFRPDARYVDCIRPCLPFCSPEVRAKLKRDVARLESKVGPPEWADAIWRATSVGGWHGFDDLGDLSSVGVELSWPGSWPNLVLFCLIEIERGPFAQDLIVVPLDDYKEQFTPGTPWPPNPDEPACQVDVFRHLEPMAADEAAGRILQAMAITDEFGAPTSEDYFMYTPMARETLAGLPAIDPPEPILATDEEQNETIRAFLNHDGVAERVGFNNDPEFAEEVGALAGLFISYAERLAGGDRYRWSPMVVEGFLHYFGDVVGSDPELDVLLNPVLTEWIGFCHHHRGWPESVTDACLETLDEHYDCAVGGGASTTGGMSEAEREQLVRLMAELGTDPDDPDSRQELTDTWLANEAWPADQPAPMGWARIPTEATKRCEAVLAIAEPVLEDLFSHHQMTSARRMVADLAVDHTAVLLRGRTDVWAGAVTYAVAQVHHAFEQVGTLFGVSEKHSPQELVDAFPTVSKASLVSKAATVRKLLGADRNHRYVYDLMSHALAMSIPADGAG